MSDSKNVYTNPSFQFPQQKIREKEFDSLTSEDQSSIDQAKQNSKDSQLRKLENDRRTIQDMVDNSNTILISISSVFPFDFFPTTINVEATRVSIIDRQLFASQVHSIDIKDISSVFIETGILFAALTLISTTYSQKRMIVTTLWKKDAILVRRIIEGLRMFAENDINTTNFSKEELLDKLKQLSETKIVL